MIAQPWWVQLLISSLPAIISSSGVWAYLSSRDRRRSATSKLLMGLAYDKIVSLGMAHIARGSITEDAYSDYVRYFYRPYKEAGGNGVADRIMEDVKCLPLSVSPHPTTPVIARSRRSRGT